MKHDTELRKMFSFMRDELKLSQFQRFKDYDQWKEEKVEKVKKIGGEPKKHETNEILFDLIAPTEYAILEAEEKRSRELRNTERY